MVPDEIMKHIHALDQWLEHLGRTSKTHTGLSVEERKQLQTVNKAAEQLQRAGVSVPEDLRRLKLQLSARDVGGSQDREVESRLKALEKVMHALGKTTKMARTIRDKLRSTGQGGGTKKYFGIELRDLLQAGVLSIKDRMELQWLKDGPVLKGKLRGDGTVMVKTPDGWQ